MYDALAARREQQIARLHAYAAAGQFPTNTDFPGELVPYFVSHDGTACAVGHLVRMDGGGALVESTAATNNHVRISDVRHGPLIDWIRESGLTQAECALIQPSYACIEDYRQGQTWLEEQERLRKHFDEVEQTLRTESWKSLGNVLLISINAQLERNPTGDMLSSKALAQALSSDEPNVRMAAAYAISKLPLDRVNQAERLAGLESNLADPDRRVRFWTAVALERFALTSPHNAVEIHLRTLPVFLAILQSDEADLRLPALAQLAGITPECIGTNRQLRIVPEVRQAIVDACRDKDQEVRDLAQEVLLSWRWQRIVYESKRMRRHYLAESYELESMLTEMLALGRGNLELPPIVAELVRPQSRDGKRAHLVYFLPMAPGAEFKIVDTEAQARQLVEDYYRTTYERAMLGENPPTWTIESVDSDKHALYYAVTAWLTDMANGPKTIFIIPRPSMVAVASVSPAEWFETNPPSPHYAWAVASPYKVRPRRDVQVVLGDAVRDDPQLFASACDVLAYQMRLHALVVADREIAQSSETLTWSERFARLQHEPRHFEVGGGGWDFFRLTMECDRSNGTLTLGVEPTPFVDAQLPEEVLTPPWVIEELKLMGWKPLKDIDFFGDMLLPPEYSRAVDAFERDNGLGETTDRNSAWNWLYRRWHLEESLPNPRLVLALLFDRAGQHKEAVRWMEMAAGESASEPGTLADIARWELSIGRPDAARTHAEAALKLWPGQPVATSVLEELAAESR